ncbi:MAG: hypothetical protein RIS64_3643 [Bacteroidota bacterium]|jgi:hypothetical protein
MPRLDKYPPHVREVVREFYFRNFLSKPLGQLAIRKKNLRILVFDEHLKKIYTTELLKI